MFVKLLAVDGANFWNGGNPNSFQIDSSHAREDGAGAGEDVRQAELWRQ